MRNGMMLAGTIPSLDPESYQELSMPNGCNSPIKLLPPAKFLRERFDYDPDTGIVRWKKRPRKHFLTLNHWAAWNGHHAGTRVGVLCDGYFHVKLKYDEKPIIYKLHRIIWKMMTGREPPASIDHIDSNRTNNRWFNLREATPSQQKWNSRHKGIQFCNGNWNARISRNGVRQYLGHFNTPEEAFAAYQAAARKLSGGFYDA